MSYKIQINFSNKLVYFILTLIIILGLGIGVYAFGTSNPSVFGHSAGEVQVNVGGVSKGLQSAIDSGDIGNKRYFFENTVWDGTIGGRQTGVQYSIIKSLCDDYCTITVGMKDWDSNQPGNVASRGPYKMFFDSSSGWWRISDTDTSGRQIYPSTRLDRTNIVSAFDCHFRDAGGLGFDMYYGGSNRNARCVLIIDD